MRRFGLIVVLILAVLGLGLATLTVPEALVRYRTTVTLVVDGKTVTGSGIIQVSYFKNIRLGGASASIREETKGAAIPIFITERDVILILMAGGINPRSNPELIVPVAFGVSSGGIDLENLHRLETLSGTREIPTPLLRPAARFSNISDPTTAKFIPLYDPEVAALRGVEVQRATIEIVAPGIWPFNLFGATGDPISTSVIDQILWIDSEPKQKQFHEALLKSGFSSGAVETKSLLLN